MLSILTTPTILSYSCASFVTCHSTKSTLQLRGDPNLPNNGDLFYRDAAGGPATVQMKATKKLRRTRVNIRLFQRRSRLITLTFINFNISSNEACLREYRFPVKYIAKVAGGISWNGGARNEIRIKFVLLWTSPTLFYSARPSSVTLQIEICGTCLFHAGFSSQWSILGSTTIFHNEKHFLLTPLRTNLPSARAGLCAKRIKEADTPLKWCVSFIDCIKNKNDQARRRSSYATQMLLWT